MKALLLSTQMFPIVSRMIGLYSLMRKMGIINTRFGLILAVSAAQIPFCAVLMSSFYANVPKSIEEAAFVDGADRNTILLRIVTPLVKPGMLAVGIYAFLMAWDDYLHAATLIQNDKLRTLSIGIALRYLGELSYDWSLINAISVVGTLPMVLLFFFFQKYMVKGLVAGAVKG
ncbi:MAG: carbohydrate ABC transporter permease [Sphaerochaetaceae bacterium]|nr:carbohydrate ABC transporter permease [Spirochaetales bacterium]MDY5500033.1 carbohydrate ABC transporter permease [Sphaerochaetaceae bacterium]